MASGLSRRQGLGDTAAGHGEIPPNWQSGLPDDLHEARRRIFKLAIISRLITCGCLIVSELLWPDWLVADDDPTVAHLPAPHGLKAFTQWDAARFLLVATHGYVDEQSYAFQPGLPWAMLAARHFCPIQSIPGLIVCGVFWTNAAFVLSAVLFVDLGNTLGFGTPFVYLVASLYCAGPSTLFHSTIYSESPFAICTLAGCVLLGKHLPGQSTVAFALGTCFRANGIVNSGFVLFAAFTNALSKPRSCRHILACLLLGVVQSLLICAPFVLFQVYGYWQFCVQAEGPHPEWCQDKIPSIYSYIQKKYWGNGLFAFWELKQIPNFIRAAPALAISFAAVYRYFQHLRRVGFGNIMEALSTSNYKVCKETDDDFGSFKTFVLLIPYAVHAGALSLLVLLEMHVHVAGRFLSAASPFFHFAVAWAFRRHEVWMRRFLWLDFILGAVLHPNGLPWP